MVRKRANKKAASGLPVFAGDVYGKWYLGSQDIANAISRGDSHDWMCQSIEEAVIEAKDKLERDPSIDLVTIVEVVRVVRRKVPVHPPIIVEKVR